MAVFFSYNSYVTSEKLNLQKKILIDSSSITLRKIHYLQHKILSFHPIFSLLYPGTEYEL